MNLAKYNNKYVQIPLLLPVEEKLLKREKSQTAEASTHWMIRPIHWKGWLAIAKLKPLSLFISLLLMLKKALDNGKMVK